MGTRPGKRTQKTMERSTINDSWVNPLFLWSFSIAKRNKLPGRVKSLRLSGLRRAQGRGDNVPVACVRYLAACLHVPKSCPCPVKSDPKWLFFPTFYGSCSGMFRSIWAVFVVSMGASEAGAIEIRY